jgi:hypothetical protein
MTGGRNLSLVTGNLEIDTCLMKFIIIIMIMVVVVVVRRRRRRRK